MGILLEDMDQLRVPEFADDFEKGVVQLVHKAKTHFEQSIAAAERSATVLPDALNLTAWSPQVNASGRMDAEHYREKFYAAKRCLKAAGALKFIPMDELITVLTNGHTQLHHDLEVGDVPFLYAEHVSNFQVNFDSHKRILSRHHEMELARTALKNGDILLTIKGRGGKLSARKAYPASRTHWPAKAYGPRCRPSARRSF